MFIMFKSMRFSYFLLEVKSKRGLTSPKFTSIIRLKPPKSSAIVEPRPKAEVICHICGRRPNIPRVKGRGVKRAALNTILCIAYTADQFHRLATAKP